MKRIGNLFKKDVVLGIKDIFIMMEIGFSIVVSLMLVFVVPKSIETDRTSYIYDATSIVKNFTHSTPEIAEVTKRHGSHYVDSREEVIKGMKKDKAALGIIISEKKDGRYKVDFLMQPYTNPALVKYVDLEMEDLLSILKPPRGAYPPDVYGAGRVTSLASGLKDEIPFNQRLLPMILMYMVGIIGLFAMVSLVGQERSDATIQAFKVSPASMWDFIISKHLMLLAVSFCTCSIIYIPMMGLKGYPEVMLIMMLTVLFGSCIGVILGGFFDSPLSGMLWVLMLIIILVLPAVSLLSPIFSPKWIRFIPTYHTLFGLDAVMFPENNRHIIWQGVGILAAINLVLFPLSGLIFGKLIRREA